jgi:hypothetical protein
VFQVCEVRAIEKIDRRRQLFNASRSARAQDLSAFGGSVNVRQPFVSRISLSRDQPIFLEPGDNARHRRRLYLLGRRQLPKGDGPAEDND